MKRSVVLLLISLSFPSIASSEIYRWRDANGKWHFSDNAPSKVEADRVQLREPNGADAVEIKHRSLPREDTQNTTSDGANLEKQQSSLCLKGQDDYTRLTRGIDHTATRKRLVLVRDGSPISRREQNRYAEKLRADYNALGCDIAQADNLRL